MGLFSPITAVIRAGQRQAEIMCDDYRREIVWSMAKEIADASGIDLCDAMERICASIAPGDEGLLDFYEGVEAILVDLKTPVPFCYLAPPTVGMILPPDCG